MQERLPADYLLKYQCLLPGKWIECDIMEQWMQYLKLGMHSYSSPDNSNHNLLEPRPEVSQQAKMPSRVLDMAEVCFLDTQVGKLVTRAHQSHDYKSVLRALANSCNFTTVKRVLLPVNTGVNTHGLYIADDGQGSHWILAELHLSSNKVHLFDWMGDSQPSYYQQVSGEVLLCCVPHGCVMCWCVPLPNQTRPVPDNIFRVLSCCRCAAPLCSLLTVMHQRCSGLCATNSDAPEMILHRRRVQKNGYDCGVWTLYTMYYRYELF